MPPNASVIRVPFFSKDEELESMEEGSYSSSVDVSNEFANDGGGGGGDGCSVSAKQLFAFLRFSVIRFVKAQADRYSTCDASAFSRRASSPKKEAVGIGTHGSLEM